MRSCGRRVTINGIAKGSGMIAPDMATMLAFVFTDAPLPAPVLQALLSRSVEQSFNAITVDGDTSTSDTILLVATGAAGTRAFEPRRSGRSAAPRLPEALDAVLLDLALQVVRDGEGAREAGRDHGRGRGVERAARRIALSIGNSPLVKTAIAGEDANWGRVVMAVGKSGEPADRDRLAIWFGGIRVAHKGERDPAYDEAAVVGRDEEAGNHREGRPRSRQGPRPRAHLRSHQGICGDQRRLSQLSGSRPPTSTFH